jgi:uncharacterized protein YcnI
MPSQTRPRHAIATGLGAGLLMLLSVPAQAVNIPEGGAVTPDSVQVIHFLVREGCDGAPTDSLEVSIPESVENVTPEAVAGWQAGTDVTVVDGAEAEAEPRVTTVRWTGGPLEDGQFLHFGLWARFPDDPGATLEFPVIQRCGEVERAWTGASDEMPAPTVTLADRIGPRGLLDLSESVSALEADVEELQTRLGDVDPDNLRSRVTDIESVLERFRDRLDGLTQRVSDLEDA